MATSSLRVSPLLLLFMTTPLLLHHRVEAANVDITVDKGVYSNILVGVASDVPEPSDATDFIGTIKVNLREIMNKYDLHLLNDRSN